MLEIRQLAAGYGRIEVLRDVTVSVSEGAFVGVLGPNGAGKSTLLRSISGLTRVTSGEILFRDRPIHRAPVEAIVASGVIHVPQGRMLFPDLTVGENLQLGAFLKSARAEYRRTLEQVEALFPILRERRDQSAGVLSGGEQQMLAIGRALMARPRLLLLDEPSLGLAPRLVSRIFGVLSQINRDGTTILVAEQNAGMVLRRAEHVFVMENGRIAHSGRCEELAKSGDIGRSYLGVAQLCQK
jgi:branched-chain amino acid transport system ATP-binding protein